MQINTTASKYILMFVSCLLMTVMGCKTHYSFSGASIPPEAKTVSVIYFQNNASLAPPTLSQTFTEALKDKLSSQTRLALTNKGGDLNFEGSVIGYTTGPIAIQSTDLAALNRLTITVSVKYTCAFDEKKNFEQSFTRYADYTSDQNLASIEEHLTREINDQLIQDIFNRALNNW
ncbi:MAG: LptE family protein [Bacteroidetes bacterium]|nr:LptE family protein [Bacteroidota bacterium]